MNLTVHRRILKEGEELMREFKCSIKKDIDFQHIFLDKYKKYEYVVEIESLSEKYLKEDHLPIRRKILFVISQHYPFRPPDIYIKHYYPVNYENLSLIKDFQPYLQDKIKEYLELENSKLYHYSEYIELFMKKEGMEDFCKTWKYQFDRKYFSNHSATIRMKETYHDFVFFFHVVDKVGLIYPNMNLNHSSIKYSQE
jgi:hypothetical protein